MTELAGAKEIVRRLREAGHRAHVVGGAVRDLLTDRPPHDIDIVTDARPDQIGGLFPGTVQVGAAFGVVLVPVGESVYDVATFRREGPYLDGRHPAFVEFATLEEDVRRRDFTINAILYDPLDGTVVDLVGGGEDLAARRIRAVGDPEERFAEDRLRPLRAVRLAAELGFTIEEATLGAIGRAAPQVTQVSAERIRDELLRLLASPGRAEGLELLRATGLLTAILPEVAAMVGVEQPPEFHPEGDVFTHTRLALSHLRDPSPLLALAVLLHDVGKPVTFERAPDRIRFHGHDHVGAEVTTQICRRLRLSGDETARVVALVADHERLWTVPQMRPARAKRFLARPDFADLLELCRVDVRAMDGDLSRWHEIRRMREHLTEEEVRPPRLITGDDLIARGYRPGPRFREILEAVQDAQLEGRVRTREDALALLARRYPQESG